MNLDEGPIENSWALEKKEILKVTNYIWKICDLYAFVEQYLYRLKRNNNIAWDYDRECKRSHLGDAIG